MIEARRKAFTARWAGTQTIFEAEAGESEPPSRRTKPPVEWTHSVVNRVIADKRFRLWTTSAWHFDEIGHWSCWAYVWNRFRKDWSDTPRLVHCRRFELEDEPV